MITLVFISVLALVSLITALAVAFSPSRAVLAISSVALSVGLSLLGAFALDMRAMFWIAPTYLLLDTTVLYFIFSTELRSGGPKQILAGAKLRLTAIVLVILGVFTLAVWELWRFSGELLSFDDSNAASIHMLLWDANMPMVVLCLLLLAPVSIGALLMVRVRD